MTDLLTVKQVAFILKVHPLTIRRYIRDKKLKAVKIAGAVRIKEDDLTVFQKAYNSPAKHYPVATHPENQTFSLGDPLWKMEGIGMSVSIPTK